VRKTGNISSLLAIVGLFSFSFLCPLFYEQNGGNMKTRKSPFSILVVGLLWTVLFTSCEKEENDDPENKEDQFVSLTSPYLICASRNPGAVGFNFEYRVDKGGTNNSTNF
jgi:hypothetical protein